MDSVIDAGAHQNQHEDHRKKIETSDDQRRGTVGPTECDQEGQDRQQRSLPLTKREHEHDGDGQQRKNRSLRHVPRTCRELIRLQHRFTRESDWESR